MLRINLTCLMLTLALIAPAAVAQDDPWQLRLGGIWIDPDTRLTTLDSDGNRSEVGSDGGIGLSLALERRFGRRLGVEVGALSADPDVDFSADLAGGSRVAVSESLGLTAITLGLNVHLTPDKAVDVYLGPFLAHVDYGDLRFVAQDSGGTVDVGVSSSDSFTVGAQIGADVPFGDGPWSLNLVGRFLDSSLDLTTGEERAVRQLDFDSLILGVGFGYRF